MRSIVVKAAHDTNEAALVQRSAQQKAVVEGADYSFTLAINATKRALPGRDPRAAGDETAGLKGLGGGAIKDKDEVNGVAAQVRVDDAGVPSPGRHPQTLMGQGRGAA